MTRRPLCRAVRSAAGVLAAGNAAILALSAWAKVTAPAPELEVPAGVAAIRHAVAVDGGLWRGGAPEVEGYRALAAAGVTTVIDLRGERNLGVPRELLDELGLERIAVPIRDGRSPAPDQVRRVLDAIAASRGIVYLHCGAGVGRTGTMAAAHAVSRGGRAWDAVRANLAVGPPSLEQLAFAAALRTGAPVERPPVALVVISRVLDAPRRAWKVLPRCVALVHRTPVR